MTHSQKINLVLVCFLFLFIFTIYPLVFAQGTTKKVSAVVQGELLLIEVPLDILSEKKTEKVTGVEEIESVGTTKKVTAIVQGKNLVLKVPLEILFEEEVADKIAETPAEVIEEHRVEELKEPEEVKAEEKSETALEVALEEPVEQVDKQEQAETAAVAQEFTAKAEEPPQEKVEAEIKEAEKVERKDEKYRGYAGDKYYMDFYRDTNYEEGLDLFKKKKYKEALARFENALEWDPHYQLALKQKKISEEKVVEQEQIREGKLRDQRIRKEAEDKEYYRTYYYKQGRTLVNRKEYQEAIGKFQESLKWDPQYEPALKYAKIAKRKYVQQIRKDREARWESESLSEERESASDLHLRRYYFSSGKNYFKKGKYKEALEKFQEALRLEPEYRPTSIYIDLSKYRILQDNLEEAVRKD
ncbi:MAG: tetratricopeptide repeat protein [Candidatus Omnitrophota bacterium]